MRQVLTTILLAVIAWPVLSEPGTYYERKEEGWFWYEVLPAESEPAPELEESPPSLMSPAPPSESPAEPEGLVPYSPAWMRENLPEYRDAAIADPSPENVRAYLYLQRLALDQAERFTVAAQQVVLADQALDHNTRRPLATAGARAQDADLRRAEQEALTKLAQVSGIWFFFASDCSYCHLQAPILAQLARQYGFAVIAISLDGQPLPGGLFPNFVPDTGQAAQFGVTTTPTLLMQRVGPEGGFAPLGAGMLAMGELRSRILMAAAESGWLPEDRYRDTRILGNALIDPPKDSPVPSDPTALAEELRRRISLPAH